MSVLAHQALVVVGVVGWCGGVISWILIVVYFVATTKQAVPASRENPAALPLKPGRWAAWMYLGGSRKRALSAKS
jgi:hypothetical protein